MNDYEKNSDEQLSLYMSFSIQFWSQHFARTIIHFAEACKSLSNKISFLMGECMIYKKKMTIRPFTLNNVKTFCKQICREHIIHMIYLSTLKQIQYNMFETEKKRKQMCQKTISYILNIVIMDISKLIQRSEILVSILISLLTVFLYS